MYFLYCLFYIPKNWLLKPSNRSNLAAAMLCCFDGRRFTTRQGSRFRTGDETPASEADSEATSLVCVAEAIRGSSGVGGWNHIPGLANCLAYDGSIWIYMDLWTKSTSSCISYDGARDGNSLTSTPCRRTILLQWHALLKVLAGSVGA